MMIENTESMSTLKFRSVRVDDGGTYVLQAVNRAVNESLNFTLEVLGILAIHISLIDNFCKY